MRAMVGEQSRRSTELLDNITAGKTDQARGGGTRKLYSWILMGRVENERSGESFRHIN